MVHFLRSAFYLLLLIFVLAACDQQPLYEKVNAIPTDGWKVDNKLTFQFPISDTLHDYDIFFHVRNFQNYSYSNLWLFIEITAPNQYIQRDTFEIMLADETGRWLGKGIGNINSMLIPYQKQINFPYRGIYTLTVQQGMREELLEDILDLGIRVQKPQK